MPTSSKECSILFILFQWSITALTNNVIQLSKRYKGYVFRLRGLCLMYFDSSLFICMITLMSNT